MFHQCNILKTVGHGNVGKILILFLQRYIEQFIKSRLLKIPI